MIVDHGMWTPEQIEKSYEASIEALSSKRADLDRQLANFDSAIAVLKETLREHRERELLPKKRSVP